MTKKAFIKSLVIDIATLVAIIPVTLWTLNSIVNATYEEYFVIGSSMQPTLFGESTKSTYGRCDKSSQAIDNLNRFDIIVCYYPFLSSSDYSHPYKKGSEITANASLKVKRVIGLPGDELVINNETFTIKNDTIGEITYGDGHEEIPFERSTPISDRIANIKLGEDEYFVMGDNWTEGGSTDCCNPGYSSVPQPIYKENIAGVVINLEGYCTIKYVYTCLKCGKTYDKNHCDKCGNNSLMQGQDIGERTPFDDGPQYLL